MSSTEAPEIRPDSRRLGRHLLWVALGVVVLSVMVGAAVIIASDSDDSSAKGAALTGRAPEFELESVRRGDGTVSLADFRGRPVVVNFFASWCAPCRKEMPAFQRVYRQVRGDVAFVGIDNEDIRTDALALLKETGVTYPTAFDPEAKVARDFGVLGMPTTVFVSASGALREQVTGEMSEERLRATITRLFEVDA